MKKKISPVVLILTVIVIIETIALLFVGFRRPVQKVSKPVVKPPERVQVVGKIAIILDDWGYNRNNVAILQKIHAPVTLAILPNLPHSRDIAELGVRLGNEVILHLPSEPYEKVPLEKKTILTSMGPVKIRQIVRDDLDSIQFARGVSNHMGSKVTENTATMESIFAELKQRKLYFLDSYVTAHSVGYAVAHSAGVPFLKRDILFDNEEDAAYILNQLNKLKNKARMYGHAVGIGHDRHLTLQVLEKAIPQMQKEGFEFVPASDLAQ